MANKKVKPANLGAAIDEILTDYAEKVVTDTKEAVEETGKLAAKTAQAYASRIGRGRYAKSIKSKTESSNSFGTTVVVYSTQYRIAHLLEHGHVVKARGRIVGTARAFPHFAPAEATAETMLVRKIEQLVKGG